MQHMGRLGSLQFRWELLLGMARREVLGRYRGSFFGLFWSLLSPLLLLGIYTFAFHEIMGARWPGVEGKEGFATMVFIGMVIHALFSECLSRSPMAIAGNPNFVKKVVFPLTVLPLVPVFTALFHAVLSITMLCLLIAFVDESFHWTAIFLPVVLAPYVLMLCGVSWLLAALGVYVRDIAQLGGMVSMALLFLSPIFYPASVIPARYASLALLNPLTLIVEQARAVLFLGMVPDWRALGFYTIVSFLVSVIGLTVFRKFRRGFADVL